jgi:hypothetical protein
VRLGPRIFMTAMFVLAAGGPWSATPAVLAQGKSYIYCSLMDVNHKRSYYSDVFPQDFSKVSEYSGAFTNYVKANYSDVIGGGSCPNGGNSARDARSTRDGDKSSWRQAGYEIIDTG